MLDSLWPRFVSPALDLSQSQRRSVHHRAWRLWWEDRRNLLLYGAAIALYLLVAIWVISPVASWLAVSLGLTSFATRLLRAAAVIVLPIAYFVLLGAVLQRLRFAPCVYQALRERGHEVCGRCGYLLRGLAPDSTHCPECGAERVDLPDTDSPH